MLDAAPDLGRNRVRVIVGVDMIPAAIVRNFVSNRSRDGLGSTIQDEALLEHETLALQAHRRLPQRRIFDLVLSALNLGGVGKT
jgi:DNA phosphorothioation-dependent restriction protein DptG